MTNLCIIFMCFAAFRLFLCLSDLNLKTQTRSAVSVREGQGVVLLCGTPSYAGGKAVTLFLFMIYTSA